MYEWICECIGKHRPVGASLDRCRPVRISLDQSKPGCPDPDQAAPEHADPDEDGLAHSGMDVAAQIQVGMDQARKASLKEVDALLGSLLTEQAGQLHAILQKMATQSNIAITALCEVSEDIHKSILALDTRLTPIRNSITDGIPDRETVVEWIISRREEDLQANSYSALATILNEAEIPTMSGRNHWTRSTVRNLIVRKKAEQG